MTKLAGLLTLWVALSTLVVANEPPEPIEQFQHHVSAFLDLNDPKSSESIDKINYQSLSLHLATTFEDILLRSNQTVWLELHVGVAATLKSLQQRTGLLGLKINLFQPKRPDAVVILAKIYALEELMAANGLSLSVRGEEKLHHLTYILEDYTNDMQTRISFGLGFPFTYSGSTRTIALEYAASENTNLMAFIGVDLGDSITTLIGVNSREFLIGITTDFSTPMSSVASGFVNGLSQLFQLPRTR